MAKVLVIPDSHLDISVIQKGLDLYEWFRCDEVVLLGDYFDAPGAKEEDYYKMLDYLKTIIAKHSFIIPLFGNHEISFMYKHKNKLSKKLNKKIFDGLYNDNRFLYAYACDSIIYSHAGVSQTWIEENKILTNNEIRYNLGKRKGAGVLEKGINRSGLRCMYKHSKENSSPVWLDAKYLSADAIKGIRQVVGHSPVKEITCLGNCWMVDTKSNPNNDEYLLVVDGIPNIIHYNEFKKLKERK